METLLIPPLKTSQVTIDKNVRLHGIDALRAIAMLLGMLLHAAVAYKVQSLPAWPHDKDFNHWAFDFLYHFIHSFRMPLFFLIAGYFCRLLFYKLGERAFIKHRVKRILVPFIYSLILILPFTILPFSIYRYAIVYPLQWKVILQHSFQEIFHWNGMAHLWFLYYMVIYYVVTIAFFQLKKIFYNRNLPAAVLDFFSFFHPAGYAGIGFFALFTWLILLMSPELYLHVDTGITPHPAYLLFFAVFFLMGWLINKRSVSFLWISGNYLKCISLGTALCILLFFVNFNDNFNYANRDFSFLFIKFLVAVQIILLVYGIIGLFFALLPNPEQDLEVYF